MASQAETRATATFLISEANGTRSREKVTIVSGQNLGAGAVVGKITASGKYKAYDNGAADGSQAAAGVLIAPVDASAADAEGTLIVRHAEVAAADLKWAAGQSGPDITAGTADLLALGIVAR